jgi:hypothetical protein
MWLETIGFLITWWTGDLGLLWYCLWILWSGITTEKINLAALVMYARLTSTDILSFVPTQLHFISYILMHVVIFFMYWLIYTQKSIKPLIFGSAILTLIPNIYNPYRIGTFRLLARLMLYIFICIRLKKDKQLPIKKYITWAWVLFTNESCWLFIPIQIVYDTYNYKIEINV